MALTPAKMKRVDMIVLERDVQKVSTALGRLGVLHLVQVKPEETGVRVLRTNRSEGLNRCRALIQRLNVLCEQIGLKQLPSGQEEDHRSVQAVEADIVALESMVSPLIRRRTEIEAQSEEIQDELLRLDALGLFNVPLARVLESPFLHFAIGTARVSEVRQIAEESRNNVILLDRPGPEDRRNVIAITSKKGRFALESLLKKHNFVRADIGDLPRQTPAQVLEGLNARLEEIRSEQKRIRDSLRQIAEERGAQIAFLVRRLELEVALLEASLNFGHTNSTCLISGWLPADYVSIVSNRLLAETEGRIVINVREAEESGTTLDEVPVLMKNHPLVRPFEMLVQGFGCPRYREIEPTPIVAISFLLMFGLMFGDVGHGAVLSLVGLILWWRSRNTEIRNIGYIVAVAGIAAVVGGFLYGSVFGLENEKVLRPLLFRPMDKVMHILILPVAMGVVVISVGVLLNIVNSFRTGDYLRGFLDRFGIIGIVFYWGAVGLGVKYAVLRRGAPSIWEIAVFIIVPLVVLFLRDLVYHLLSGKSHGGEGGFVLLMHGGIDVMETLSSYLANTVSFARVGAFALAHAGLCVAIFSLEGMVRGLPAGALWSAVILVLGNALVIGLEGLIVFIQCLRLEYYEFFGKFFGGSGRKYAPFRLR